MLAAQTAMSLKDVAKLVVGLGDGLGKNKASTKNKQLQETNSELTNKVY